MNARELHGTLSKFGVGVMDPEMSSTILRALDLLARVEESEAEIVKNLRDEADLCRNETATDIADLLDDAASCIVAMASQFSALKAERDRLKTHAEAMASELLDLRDGRLIGTQAVVVDQYRRDFPKDAP